MSTDNDLISSFRLAAEALEKLPQLQESHAQKEADLVKAIEDNAKLQMLVNDLQTSICDLGNKVRSLEVERDDAGFRELEAQDKLQTLLRTLGAVAGIVNTTVAEHTPKPEVVEPIAAAEATPQAQGVGSISTTMVTTAKGPGIGHNSQVEPRTDRYRDSAFDDPSNQIPSSLPHDEAAPAPTVIITSNASDGPVDEWHAPQIEEVTKPLPFLNTPAMDKPDSVSWKDFVSGGGRRPFWVTDEMMELGQSTSAA